MSLIIIPFGGVSPVVAGYALEYTAGKSNLF